MERYDMIRYALRKLLIVIIIYSISLLYIAFIIKI